MYILFNFIILGLNVVRFGVSTIFQWSVLLMEETGGPGENHENKLPIENKAVITCALALKISRKKTSLCL
jgi:hypothetical protein